MKLLSEYFDSRDAGEFIEMWCRGCNRGWLWSKEKTSGRDLLPLTNHARKHLPSVKIDVLGSDEPELPFRESKAKILPVRRHTRGRSKGKKATASTRRRKSKAA
jgi:hypothetical protein